MKDCIVKMDISTDTENMTLQVPLPLAKHFKIRPILFKIKKQLASNLQNLLSCVNESALGLYIEVETNDCKIIVEVITYAH